MTYLTLLRRITDMVYSAPYDPDKKDDDDDELDKEGELDKEREN